MIYSSGKPLMKKRYAIIGLVFLFVGINAFAKDYLVSSHQEFNERVKALKPGDNLVMATGVWSDFDAVFKARGTEEKPITLTVEEKGRVVLSGQSSLRIAGEHLIVSGLVFRNGYTPRSSVISFRRTKDDIANHTRVTETVIDNYNNPERTETDYWVAMYGKHNRFDHNHLVGKRNRGVTMAVRLEDERSQENYHRIDHNYFGPRPVLGSNGGETLRIGTSRYSLSNSFTTVENNYFDRCDGELEIISSKSGGNIYRGNVFFESRGTLTLRHGNGNLVEQNVFFGNGVDHTGGIRVINADQTIRNNYMEALAGYRFGSAFVVMNGVYDSPINRYHQVDRAVIENNSVVVSGNVQLAAGSDDERQAIPVNSTFSNNLIHHENEGDNFTVYDDVSGIEFKNNYVNALDSFQISSGFKREAIELERADNGLLYPTDERFDGIGVSKMLQPVTKDQTGVNWYPKRAGLVEFGGGNVIDIAADGEALADAVAKAEYGDVLRLEAGDYLISRILQIKNPIVIASMDSPTELEQGNRSVNIQFERGTLFEIVDGGSLYLRGVNISGDKAPDSAGNSVIRTQRVAMLKNYQLVVEYSNVSDLNVNHSFNFLSASKSTLADSIDISHSSFENITGAVLKLDAENDDYGIYNSDYVNILDSQFKAIGGAVVDFYRGGTDESTFGPHFLMRNSEIENVGSGKRNRSGGAVYLHGIQVTTIDGNQFSDSPAIQVAHTVGEPVTKILNNRFDTRSALPVVRELNSSETDTATFAGNSFDSGEDQ